MGSLQKARGHQNITLICASSLFCTPPPKGGESSCQSTKMQQLFPLSLSSPKQRKTSMQHFFKISEQNVTLNLHINLVGTEFCRKETFLRVQKLAKTIAAFFCLFIFIEKTSKNWTFIFWNSNLKFNFIGNKTNEATEWKGGG